MDKISIFLALNFHHKLTVKGLNILKKESYYDSIYKTIKDGNQKKFRKLFLKLHDRDQVEFFNSLYPENKTKITYFIDPLEFADLFEEMSFKEQVDAFHYLENSYLQDVFAHVADDDVREFMNQLEEDKQDEALRIMKPEDRQAIERMLQYENNTAGSVMTTELITVNIEDTADDVIRLMKKIGEHAETIYYIYVVNQKNQLVGVLSLRELLLSPGTKKIEDIMNTQIVSIKVSDNQREAAHIIQAYDLVAVPVLGEDNVLLGIVTVDDVLDIIRETTDRDFRRFGGITSVEDEDTKDETVFQMTRKRLPWIIILIFLGLISANLISAYESTLEQVVALAAFMPIILDSAGNVGTQSLAVSVRRLSMNQKNKENFWRMIGKEFGSGILIGIASFITISILSYIIYGNWILSLIIGISLLATLSLSTVIGALVPEVFDKVGIDPAVASGPFITTINDTFALIIYFSLATYLINHI